MIYQLPQVSEVAVIGVPHPRWVEAVVAVIVVKAGQSLSKGTVHAHCAENRRISRCRRTQCSPRHCRRIQAVSF